MSRRGFSNGGGGRRDAKQMSKQNNRFARLDPDIASRYEDVDDDLTVPARSGGQFSNRGRGGPRPGQAFGRNNASIANTGARNSAIVFKVRVPFGAKKYSMKWLIRQLNQKIENLKPILLGSNQRGDIEFYIKDEDVADAIQANSRRIFHRETSSKVDLLCTKVTAPWMALKKNDIDIINIVVDRRYNAESRMLDLSDFANDQEFTSRDMHMMLTKNNVMLAVIDRIDEKYGNITALSLRNNRLRYLDYASSLVSVAKFIKVLELSHNQISTEADFEKLSGLPVETLFLEGNPICEELTSASDYLSFVHKTFPRVGCLDGTVVEQLKVATMDEDVLKEFPFRAGYYANDDLRRLVEQFIMSFYQIYDGEDAQKRKTLVEAYDENNSSFTLTICNLKDSQPMRYSSDECYSLYVRQSHNILQQEKWNRNRSAKTTRGAMDIAVALSKLPITNHYPESFIVDVFLVTNELLGFTLQGLFEDGSLTKNGTSPDLNYFSRTFTVAPRAEGRVAVISDTLFISACLTERVTRYKRLLDSSAVVGAAAVPVAEVNPTQQAVIGVGGLGFNGEPPKELKDQMVAAFCTFSGMVVPWSTKCLQDFAWDYDLASQNFTRLKNNLPREAFA